MFVNKVKLERQIAARISACFPRDGFEPKVFQVNGQNLEIDGEVVFNKASQVDLTITALNDLIKELNNV